MRRRDRFTREHPPKSGNAKRLWDWWIKHTDEPPEAIHVLRPGYWQRTAGTPRYSIEGQYKTYSVWDVDETLKITPADGWSCFFMRVHGDVGLE